MRVLVVVAAGSGTRLGGPTPKALVPLDGLPLVGHCVRRLSARVDRVVVTAPAGHEGEVMDAVAGHDVRVVVGGDTRSESVSRGVAAAAAADDDVVAIHDAARALTPGGVLDLAIAAVEHDVEVLAAAPALPVVDTLKRACDGVVIATPSRDHLHLVQTPQVARAATWRIVHDGTVATDDLGLVEQAVRDGRLTGRVVLTTGSVLAAKITHPVDLRLAVAMLADEQALLAEEGWS